MTAPRDPTAGLARATLLHKLGGYVETQLIAYFAALGVADHMAAGPLPVQLLAAALNLPPDRCMRLVRGWVLVGLLQADSAGYLTATPLGRILAADHPDSLREYACLAGEVWYPAWAALAEVGIAERPPFVAVFGATYYDYLAQNPVAGARFQRFMDMRTVQTAAALGGTYDFTHAQTVVDLGGGQGTLVSTLLQTYPHLHGMVFDHPAEAGACASQLAEAGVATRCEVVTGDFFTDPLPLGDHYILSQILHNWDDAACLQLLRQVRRAIPEDGVLLIIEYLLPPQLMAPPAVVEADLMMLVLLGGRERTEAAYAALLADSGFTLAGVQPLHRLGFSLLTVTPNKELL